jgi:hypothetical protein
MYYGNYPNFFLIKYYQVENLVNINKEKNMKFSTVSTTPSGNQLFVDSVPLTYILGWGHMSAQNASVVTTVMTPILEINKRGECYASFWLHCRHKTMHHILQLCGVFSNVCHKVRSLQWTYFVWPQAYCIGPNSECLLHDIHIT